MKILRKTFKKIEKKYFSNFGEFNKYSSNILWMFSGKSYFILVSGLMSIFVARYLKPENYGLISYGLSLIAIFSPFITLGLEQILIQDLIKNNNKKNILLGSSFFLKLVGGLLGFLALNSFNLVIHTDKTTQVITFVFSLMFLFKAFDVVNFYLQSKAKIKYYTIIEGIILTISSLLKIILILNNKNTYSFSLVYLLEPILLTLGQILIYKYVLKENLFEWKFDLEEAKKILKKSYPLVISSVMVTIYMKIDQVIIANILGTAKTGLYAVAVKLSEMWYFIPVSFVTATYPSLIGSFQNNKDKFNKRFKQLNLLLLLINLFIAIFISIFGSKIIRILYGAEYLEAVSVLKIYIWASIPISLSLTSHKWLIINKLQKYNMHSTTMGSISNIILNFILIPKWGIIGSAWATLISYTFSGFLAYLFFKETRELFFIQCKSLLFLPNKKTSNE